MTNKQSEILSELDHDLKTLASDPGNVKDYSRFIKGTNKLITLTTPVVRNVSADYFQKIKDLKKEEVWEICDELLKTRNKSSMHIAFDWAFRMKKQYQKEDFELFQNWIENYVTDWSGCDDLCTRALGFHLWKFPENKGQLYWWADSPNIWLRRAAAVSLIYSARKKPNLGVVFDIADRLLTDEDDLVQKGYGWLLKVTSKIHEQEVFNFVIKHKEKMPRTALRYAIEKMPQNMREEAMKTEKHKSS